MQTYGIEHLRRKLAAKQSRVRLRYRYYDMKNSFDTTATIIPSQFVSLKAVLGWCAKAVDTLADRLVFDRFTDDDYYLNELFDMNSRDIFTGAAIKDALIAACSFVYISADETGYPRLQVINGHEATGVIDPITNLLTEGYAVLERDGRYAPENEFSALSEPTVEAYFTAGRTEIYRRKKLSETFTHKAPYALLVPMIFKPDASRPFGHSRISRSNMALVRSAARTLWRSEVSAEFYSFPQKYVLGLSPKSTPFDRWKATVSTLLRFDKDPKSGDHPVIGQFQQQSMTPYTEQLKMFASVFAGENGLTLDDLGFSTSNPTTAEAIKAAHENLRLTAQAAQRSFGTGLINVGYLAACLRDRQKYDRFAFADVKTDWQPIFTVEPSELGTLGDAVLKIQQAFPDYFTEDKLRRLTGL